MSAAKAVAPSDAILSMQGVRKAFGSQTALKDLSFSVKTGEIFGFLGPSGAGKTTTIKVLTRQLKADSGEVTLFGEELSKLPQKIYDEIGILSDNSGAYERLSVYDNLMLYAELKRLKKQKIDEALEAVELHEDRAKKVKALSRGMKQRLMLAQVVMHEPRLLFLDEPTASLDPGTCFQIHKLLRRLNKNGTTIFLTTHNMEEADKLCDRVAFLDQGTVVTCDAPEQLKIKHAKSELVARLQSGETLKMEKSREGILQLAEKLADDALLTLHSSEPNLEEIFLALTGRELS